MLLILAGISIAMLNGQNGVLNRAQDAKLGDTIGAFNEQVRLAQMSTKTSITANMSSKAGYIATAKDSSGIAQNLKDLADDVAKGVGLKEAIEGKASNTGNPDIKINTEGYTVAYYLDEEGNGSTNGDGYIVIWFTNNSLRSSIKDRDEFIQQYGLKDVATDGNKSRNQAVLVAVIKVENYDCNLIEYISLTSVTDGNNDIGNGLPTLISSSKDVRSAKERFILMENGDLYEINDLVDTQEMNLPFNNENLDLSLYTSNVKDIFWEQVFLTYDNKIGTYNNLSPEIIAENAQKIVYSNGHEVDYIDSNDTYYKVLTGTGTIYKIADNVELANSLDCYYCTKDGKVYEYYFNSEVCTSNEITDTEEKNEIKENLEYSTIYDVNDEESALDFRSLSTFFSTTEYECSIEYIKENGEWYYNTSINYGGGIN